MTLSLVRGAVCAAALAALASPAIAQDSPFSYSGTVTLTTDYVFRGISQTQNDPALQGSFDVSHSSGLYAGAWASNVDFNDPTDTNIEIDLYAGFTNEIDKFSYDVGVIYYLYPDSGGSLNALGFPADYDYLEFKLLGAYDFDVLTVTGGLYYSPDFFAESDDAVYLTGGIAVPFYEQNGVTLTFDANIGVQWIDDEAAFGLRDYVDWNAGITLGWEGFEFGLRYTDTDFGSGCFNDVCDAKAVLSVSRAL